MTVDTVNIPDKNIYNLIDNIDDIIVFTHELRSDLMLMKDRINALSTSLGNLEAGKSSLEVYLGRIKKNNFKARAVPALIGTALIITGLALVVFAVFWQSFLVLSSIYIIEIILFSEMTTLPCVIMSIVFFVVGIFFVKEACASESSLQKCLNEKINEITKIKDQLTEEQKLVTKKNIEIQRFFRIETV